MQGLEGETSSTTKGPQQKREDPESECEGDIEEECENETEGICI